MASQLAPGFLVAAPALLDPHFKRSVVLLVDHRPEGSLGFVINRPAEVGLGVMLEKLGLSLPTPSAVAPSASSVLVGGPVAPHTGWVVFEQDPSADANDDVVRVSERLAVTASRELLETLATRGGPQRMVLVLGYAGWGPGQLDAEIAQGSWIPVDFDDQIVFDTPFDARWSSALRILGIDPARLSMSAPSES
jgi:putative transcriptional regulator